MIKTKDEKKFFTDKKNLHDLIEFSKIFNAEISIVKIPETTQLLSLAELAPAMCEKKQSQISDVKVIKVIGKKYKKNKSNSIKGYIEKEFLDGKDIVLKKLVNKYKTYNLALGCMCNYLSSVRKNLEQRGYKIAKLGGGHYKLY